MKQIDDDDDDDGGDDDGGDDDDDGGGDGDGYVKCERKLLSHFCRYQCVKCLHVLLMIATFST